MYRYEIYVPLTNNAGEDIPAATFDALHGELKSTFGGYTRNPTELVGVWVGDDGVTYRDRINIYTIFADTAESIRTAALYVADHFQQLAVAVIHPDNRSELVWSLRTAAAAA